MYFNNKELFDILVSKLFDNTLVLNKKYLLIFSFFKKHYFYERNKCDCPINKVCKDNISKIYYYIAEKYNAQTFGKDIELSQYINNLKSDIDDIDDSTESTRVLNELTIKVANYIFPLLEIESMRFVKLGGIIDIFLLNLPRDNKIDFGEALYKIRDNSEYGVVLTVYGNKLADEYEHVTFPKFMQDFIYNEKDRILIPEKILSTMHNQLYNKHWLALDGSCGTGKYTLAIEYAMKKKNKYDNIITLKWDETLDTTLSNLTSTDDKFFCTNETSKLDAVVETKKERTLRKIKILNKTSQTNLIIIYGIDKDIKKNLIEDKLKNENNCFIFAFDVGTRLKSIKTPIQVENDYYISMSKKYLNQWVTKFHNDDIEKIIELSNKNFYIFILLLKYLNLIKEPNCCCLYEKINKTPSLYGWYSDDMIIEMNYHGKKIQKTILEHLNSIYHLDAIEQECKFKYSCVAWVTKDIMSAKSIDYLLDLNTSELSKRNFIRYNKCKDNIELSPIQRLVYSKMCVEPYEITKMIFCKLGFITTNIHDRVNATDMVLNCYNLLSNSAHNIDAVIKNVHWFSYIYKNIYRSFYECVMLPTEMLYYSVMSYSKKPVDFDISEIKESIELSHKINEQNILVIKEQLKNIFKLILGKFNPIMYSGGLILQNNQCYNEYKYLQGLLYEYACCHYLEEDNLESYYVDMISENCVSNLFVEIPELQIRNKICIEYRLNKSFFSFSVRFLKQHFQHNIILISKIIIDLLGMKRNKELLKIFFSYFNEEYEYYKRCPIQNIDAFRFIASMDALKIIIYKEFDYDFFINYADKFEHKSKYMIFMIIITSLISVGYDKAIIDKIYIETKENIGMGYNLLITLLEKFYYEIDEPFVPKKNIELLEDLSANYNDISEEISKKINIIMDKLYSTMNDTVPRSTFESKSTE